MTQPTPVFPHDRYAELLAETMEHIKFLSTLKGGEYTGDLDRLANFRRNGSTLGLPMEAIWAVYYNKHHDAVMQFIQDQVAGKQRTRAEPIAGRVYDMMTYLVLFLAMLEEGEAAAIPFPVRMMGTKGPNGQQWLIVKDQEQYDRALSDGYVPEAHDPAYGGGGA